MEHPVHFTSPWKLKSKTIDDTLTVAGGSNFLCGNGYLGYRGTFPHWRKDRFTACIVSDTWDNADGKWRELCNVPNALFTALTDSFGVPLETESHQLELDIKRGVVTGSWKALSSKKDALHCTFSRYADTDTLHRIVQHITIESETDSTINLLTGIDMDLWSLNGDHFSTIVEAPGGVDLITGESGIRIAVRQLLSPTPDWSEVWSKRWSEADGPPELPYTLSSLAQPRLHRLHLKKGDRAEFSVTMVVVSSRDVQEPDAEADRIIKETKSTGYKQLQLRHEAIWDASWEKYGIEIESDDNSWGILNFNTYHNIIATPGHTDHLPIGARGFSCQAYQGAAFWDQEIFNLPGHIYANPETARRVLSYRAKTIAGARAKAKKLGFEGAFFAWVSGDSGEELCPDYFFVDVLTGRKIRNHFNDWQIHVSPDIAYAIDQYYTTTGDEKFYIAEGALILLEVARFIASRVVYLPRRDRYEIHQVLGPDEYHENANNNLFTNIQCRFAIDKALSLLTLLEQEYPHRYQELLKELSLSPEERSLWLSIREKLHIPGEDPQTKLLPQFDGYFQLEDIAPGELEKRLQNPEEYWGWPNGIAYETQVIKQADIVQLFYQHPRLYSKDQMEKNFLYYEKRTQHRSSLSPAIHAIVAARLGMTETAYRYFQEAGTIDLYSSKPGYSGGTFIGGIHTAACGIAGQMAIQGFGGFEVGGEGIHISPALPRLWKKLRFNYTYRDSVISFEIDHQRLKARHTSGLSPVLLIHKGGGSYTVRPGEMVEIPLV
jgi:1,2-alpha-glucosylglycerol phosphorylase